MRSAELKAIMLTLAMALNVGGAFAAERTWTRSEILAVADKEALRLGRTADLFEARLDDNNSFWEFYFKIHKKAAARNPHLKESFQAIEAKLNGRSYWAVNYVSLKPEKTAGLFVFIDRKTCQWIASVEDKYNAQGHLLIW